jgi:hypothetical protein
MIQMSKRNYLPVLTIIFVLLMIFSPSLYKITGHGGNSGSSDDHYQVPYSDNDVSMKIERIEISLGSSVEYNVSITEENKTMTIIVAVHRNTGSLWGLYFENISTYYTAKNGSLDPQIFCSTDLSTCCQKIFDHVDYYASTHITRPVGESYVIALYNTHFHDEETAVFDLTILSGHIGEETKIQTPPSKDIFTSFIILTIVTGIGAFSIGLVMFTLVIKPRRR